MTERSLDSLPPQIEEWGNQFFGAQSQWSAQKQSGGINNHVFLCESDQKRVIVKSYPQLARSGPDRFIAEKDFLSYSNVCAPNFVPRLLAADECERLLVMQVLDGESFQPGRHVTGQDVRRAADFISTLTANLDVAQAHITQPAAEGFLSLTEHLNNVQNRIGYMTTSHVPQNSLSAAKVSLKRLQDLHADLTIKTMTAIQSGDVEDSVHADMLCASPSDFGFHNAITSNGMVKFIDFEFAGWDDPAKLVCDFFLQPRLPVPQGYISLMRQAVASVMAEDALQRRIKHLWPILQLKWAAIILAVLQPKRLENLLDITSSQSKDALFTERLATVSTYLKDGAYNGVR